MNCFDSVEERYMLNIHLKNKKDIRKILDVQTSLYKEIQGDWLVFFMDDDSDFLLLYDDIRSVRDELYRLKYEAENCFYDNLYSNSEEGFYE